MCGSSVHFDRAFLGRRMPEAAALFHYRNIDVSTINELGRRWAPDVHAEIASAQPESNHRADDDVYRSIALLRAWRDARMLFAP